MVKTKCRDAAEQSVRRSLEYTLSVIRFTKSAVPVDIALVALASLENLVCIIKVRTCLYSLSLPGTDYFDNAGRAQKQRRLYRDRTRVCCYIGHPTARYAGTTNRAQHGLYECGGGPARVSCFEARL